MTHPFLESAAPAVTMGRPMEWDRLKKAFMTLARKSTPRIDYFALYRARVVVQNSDRSLDVAPDDPKIPSMGGIQLRHGVPGLDVTVMAGTSVLVGWSGGDPSEPYCCLWNGDEVVTKLVLNAKQIIMGSEAGAEPAAKGATLQEYLETLVAALAAHTHGGVTDPLLAPTAIAPPNVQATNVKVK